MEIVSEGSLESISRPSSTSKPSSRSGKRNLTVQGSFELLPPEDSSDFSLPQSLFRFEEEVVIEDVDDDGPGLTSDEELDEELEQEEEEWTSDEDQESIDASSSFGGQEIAIIQDSQDDGSILADNSRESTPAIEEPHEDDLKEEEEENIDPKLRKGLEKIKKLDEILSDKIKKEKQVKEHRRLLEKMWREQIDQMDSQRELEGHGKIELGPGHFLALGPPEHYAHTDSGRESPPVTPVFATQPIPDATNDTPRSDTSHLSNQSSTTSTNTRSSSRVSSDSRGSKASKASSRTSKDGSRKSKGKTKDSDKKSKDFIQRNIKLAADAANVIPMTVEEKKRLDEIMNDDNDLFMVENPFSTLSLTAGEGFVPSADDNKTLEDIDEKLKSLLPCEEHDLISSETPSILYQDEDLNSVSEVASDGTLTERDGASTISTTHSEKKTPCVIDIDSIGIGERVLREEKEMRDMKQRLQDIERKLQMFHQSEDEEQGVISQDLLRQLLDSSTRTTTRATTISQAVNSRLILDTPRTDADSISEYYDTPRTDLDTGRNSQNTHRTITSSMNTSVDSEQMPSPPHQYTGMVTSQYENKTQNFDSSIDSEASLLESKNVLNSGNIFIPSNDNDLNYSLLSSPTSEHNSSFDRSITPSESSAGTILEAKPPSTPSKRSSSRDGTKPHPNRRYASTKTGRKSQSSDRKSSSARESPVTVQADDHRDGSRPGSAEM